MIHVIARMDLRPGCLDNMLEIMSKLVPVVRAEDGCISYTPCVDIDAKNRDKFLTIVETWESEAHLQAHLAAKHMAEFRDAVKDLRTGATVTVVSPVM